jgi:N-acetylmuramoyl-L-alanine amidase
MKRTFCTLFFVFLFSPLFFVYAQEPIKVLIVPGHDNQVWGSQYGKLKEADMNLALGTQIYNLLKKDERFEMYITRDSGGYVPVFDNYFKEHEQDITLFKENAKQKKKMAIENGTFIEKESVPHVAVKSYMANVLYGINKWSNENKMDIVLHIHFNDYPRQYVWTKGKYKGFTIYVPEKQMANAGESKILAQNIFDQLAQKYAVSNYEKEVDGIIEDQSLIALGSNGTLDSSVRSILVEYGYIYRFGNRVERKKAYTNMANLTVAGIKDYFFIK